MYYTMTYTIKFSMLLLLFPILSICVAFHISLMFSVLRQFCGADKPSVKPEELEVKHKELTRVCIEQFRSTRKMGGDKLSQPYEDKLQQQILESYECFAKRNKEKQTASQHNWVHDTKVFVAGVAGTALVVASGAAVIYIVPLL